MQYPRSEQVSNTAFHQSCVAGSKTETKTEKTTPNSENFTDSKPIVSVVCFVYNHERYVAKALQSIVDQETSFSFEVIVHDDASTDDSISIIRNFAKQYPNLIKTIFEEENQYSRGVSLDLIIEKHVHGKYVAFCEGDDYWSDPTKLRRQYDYMRLHDDCDLVVHGADILDDRKKKIVDEIMPCKSERDFSYKEIVNSEGGLFATASFFFRAEKYVMPDEYLGWGVGDYPRQLYLASMGRVHFINRKMSVYRKAAVGSWSARMRNDIEAYSRLQNRIADKMDALAFGEDRDRSEALRLVARRRRIKAAVKSGRLDLVEKDERLKSTFSSFPLRQRVTYRLYANFAVLINAVRRRGYRL